MYEFTTEEKVTNAAGGSQSKPMGRADLLPPKALMEIAKVLEQGAIKYGEYNWKHIEVTDHINHAMIHILAHNAGDTAEEHLTHATTRLLFALELIAER
ncbi:hypothetical protein A4L_20 [Anabaena phage A-4L]|uniref:dATP/dGTP diphosphohydrolase N-terminal domain-containing protein n=1 Tax=Anabaena phage A-4L TaxID=1357732 RepID=A0A059PYA6_9CAUD|nr:hypothetical protein A4L_20 [Anabaena phage A-4L]AGR48547.1 hypothetical protein A4L_20 [Anabaena phage A-4L]